MPAAQLYNDVLETALVLREFKAALDEASNALYSLWRRLQDVRKKQGYISTRVVLVGRRVNRENEGEGCSLNRHWNALHAKLRLLPPMLGALFDLMHAPDDDQQQKPQSSLSKAPMARQNSTSIRPTDGFDKAKSAHSRALQALERIAHDLMTYDSNTLIPAVVFTVTSSGTCTPDVQVPLGEIDRRRKLRRVKIRVMLKVNGQVLASSSPQLLQWPALKVDISRMFELRVLHEPREAVFEVYASYESKNTLLSCCSDLFSNETLIATVGVPLAQRITQNSKRYEDNLIPAVCYVPVMGWYSFSSQKLMNASRGRGLSMDSNNRPSHLSSIRFEGALLCGSEYDVAFDRHNKSVASTSRVEGVFGSELAFIPGQVNSEWRSESHGRIVGGAVEFTKEKDFFELLPPLNLLDINDPRNDKLIGKKVSGILSGRMKKRDIFQLGGEFVARLHSENGLSYGHFIKMKTSSRIRLLRLRELKPYLFTERIPLSEEAIRHSALFKNLLLRADRTAQLADGHATSYFQEGPSTGDLEEGAEDTAAYEGRSKKAIDFLARVRDSQIVLSRRARKKKVFSSQECNCCC